MFLSKLLSFIGNSINYAISFAVYGFLLLTLWDIVIFIGGYSSNYCTILKGANASLRPWFNYTATITENGNIWQILMLDFALLSLFFISHSLHVPEHLKSLVPKHLWRSIYISTTSLTLECLMCWWVRIPGVTLWACDTTHSAPFRWFFMSVEAICWMSIYSECITMDLLEMIGFKQVYYRSIGMSNPIERKAERLQTFYKHMRHPGFTGFTIILWCRPVMTLDRLLMAFAVTVYMLGRFSATKNDYQYIQQQVQAKFSAQ